MHAWRRILGALIAVIGALAIADRIFPPDLSRARALSSEVQGRDGTLLAVFPAQGGIWRLKTTTAQVDPRYLALLLAAEDRRFFDHPGIDPVALARAAWQWARAGHIVSGGSTLTMQTARLLEPHPRGILGKLHDIVRAAQLERRFSKNEILGLYLTLCPFGGNLEGVRAASLAWFGQEPSTLTAGEAALLVATPPAPSRRRADRHPTATITAANRLLARLAAAQELPAGYAGAIPPTVHGRAPMPRLSGFLAARLAHAAPPGTVIASTIDPALQRHLDALIARETAGLEPELGVAAIVAGNHNRGFLASYGGRGAAYPGGDIDLTRTRRSPGSALKPFIYGLAFDNLILHPQTLIADAPGPIGGYAPQNFDTKYHGTVTAAQALAQSFNIPAVKVLQRVGPVRFIDTLRAAGTVIDLPPGRPGLAVALGGVGINLYDLATLYTSLADGGQAAPLTARAGESPVRTPFLGTLAAYYLPQILRRSPPPPGMAYGELTGAREVAFKTGTSFGFRDAWAAGFSTHYTVAVWLGRVEGSPRPGAYGRNTAAPLMFHIFSLLPAEDPAIAQPPPEAILATRTDQLPPALRRLAGDNPSEPGPHIAWPPQNAAIDLVQGDGGRYAPIHLRADRGAPPFRWFVNGMPLRQISKGDGAADWQPDGPGFTHLRLVDERDEAVSATFRLVTTEN